MISALGVPQTPSTFAAGPVTAEVHATGLYFVFLPSSLSRPLSLQVTAMTPSRRCSIDATEFIWQTIVWVRCRDRFGVDSPSSFVLNVAKSDSIPLAGVGGYTRVNPDGSTFDTANSCAGDTSVFSRVVGSGKYFVRQGRLPPFGSFATVVADRSDRYCKLTSLPLSTSPGPAQVNEVACFTSSGTPADSGFALSVGSQAFASCL
jgi:hypothetical protein